MSAKYKSPPVKPRITIHATGGDRIPWLFKVTWPRNHWQNSQWYRFDDALVAAGVKKL